MSLIPYFISVSVRLFSDRRRKEMRKTILIAFAFCVVFSVLPGYPAPAEKPPLQQAKELYNNEQYQQAIPLFKKAAKENPKKADEANYFIGMCQSKMENYAQAVNSFSQALKLREDNYPQALRGRADAEMAQKSYDAAIADYQKLLAASPDDMDIAFQMGQAQYYKDNYSEAINYLKKVADARPQDPQVHYFAGWVYYKLKQYDQTIREFEIYVKLCPDCPEAAKIKEILRSLKR
jgi:tetratricopeptide (TPR) repeat protein